MEDVGFDPSQIGLKTLENNRQYPKRKNVDLLPGKEGLRLRRGTTEIKVPLNDNKEEVEAVGVVKLTVPKEKEVENIEEIRLYKKVPGEREPKLVKAFKKAEIPRAVGRNLLRKVGKVDANEIVVTIEKHSGGGRPLRVTLDVRVCRKSTTAKTTAGKESSRAKARRRVALISN